MLSFPAPHTYRSTEGEYAVKKSPMKAKAKGKPMMPDKMGKAMPMPTPKGGKASPAMKTASKAMKGVS